MSMRSLEALILHELRLLTANPRLRQKDILAWQAGTMAPRKGEKIYHLTDPRVDVAVKAAEKEVKVGR